MGYILLGYISRIGLPKIDDIDDLSELTLLTVFQMYGMHEQCSVHSAADSRMSGIWFAQNTCRRNCVFSFQFNWKLKAELWVFWN